MQLKQSIYHKKDSYREPLTTYSKKEMHKFNICTSPLHCILFLIFVRNFLCFVFSNKL